MEELGNSVLNHEKKQENGIRKVGLTEILLKNIFPQYFFGQGI